MEIDMPTLNEHEKQLVDHEKRIRNLELSQAILEEHVKMIRKWAGWGVAILAGSFLVQLVNVVIKGMGN